MVNTSGINVCIHYPCPLRLGRISERKWMGMGKFKSDDYCIYYCGQEYLILNGVALILNKRV